MASAEAGARGPVPGRPDGARRRSRWRWLLAIAALAVLSSVLFYWASRPRQVSALVLGRLGASLGLQITAGGAAEYELWGTPRLVLRDVTVRQPGVTSAVLRARRIHVALPWSTVRSGGEPLVLQRLELDAPTLDIAALQRWQATRPPTAPRLPTLTGGFRVRDGAIVGAGWRLDGLQADAPYLGADQPLRSHLRARYLAAPLSVDVDTSVVVMRPGILVAPGVSGFAVHGPLRVERANEWRMPAYLRLSGPLHRHTDGFRLAPARIGLAATLETKDTRLPFSVGAHGPLQLDGNGVRLGSASFAVRGRGDPKEDPLPSFVARGEIALGTTLRLQLDGSLAAWPRAWPALPSPLDRSDAPLPFALRYDGNTSLESPAMLELARDDTRFAARFRLPEVLAWAEHIRREGIPTSGSPLPPLSGSLATPRLELEGVTLEGVRLELEDEP